MVGAFENIFNFRMTWKLHLKFLYFFAKIHAIAHFTYDEKRKKACYSFVSAVYGLFWAVGFFIELILLLFSFGDSDSVVFHFVHATELTTIVINALLIYLIQIILSKDLVLLINDAISINQVINYDYRKEVNVFGAKFQRLYKFKMQCLLLQFVLLFVSYYIYVDVNGGEPNEIILGFLIVYTHFSTVVVSGIFFCGSLLLGYDFYYFLNRKARQIFKKLELNRKSRTQIDRFCQACDELDKLSVVYSRINTYIARINRIAAVQITGELLGSFIMITSAVSKLLIATKIHKSHTYAICITRYYSTHNILTF